MPGMGTRSDQDPLLRFGRHRGGIHRAVDRDLAVVLCVTILFGAYFIFLELDRVMGKGAIVSLFFKRPRTAGGATA